MEPPKQRVQLFKERVPSASEDAKKPNFEDDWVGNPGLKPNKGRKLTHPPADPKGRTDGLFTVLKSDTANPGQVKEDGWIGNMSTDPASGKARATPPEERRGRWAPHATLACSVQPIEVIWGCVGASPCCPLFIPCPLSCYFPR